MGKPLGIDRASVLALKAKGLTIREVAQRLGCSVAAVEYHLYPKLRERKLRENAERHKTEKYKEYSRKHHMKHYWSDPEFRSRRLEAMRKYKRERYRSDPEFRSKQRQSPSNGNTKGDTNTNATTPIQNIVLSDWSI